MLSASYRFDLSSILRRRTVHVDYSAIDRLQHLYDLCMVWASEVSRGAAVEGDPGQLGHRLLRVLPAGARQPDRREDLFAGPTEGYPGGDYAGCLWGLLHLLFWRQAALEPLRCLLLLSGRSLLHV